MTKCRCVTSQESRKRLHESRVWVQYQDLVLRKNDFRICTQGPPKAQQNLKMSEASFRMTIFCPDLFLTMEGLQASIQRWSAVPSHEVVNFAPKSEILYGSGGNVYITPAERKARLLDRQRKIAILIALAMVIAMAIAASVESRQIKSQSELVSFVNAPSLDELKKTRAPPDVSAFQGCTVKPIVDRPSDEVLYKLKPFWVPTYPNTDPGILLHLIDELTGIKHAYKNYYAKGHGLKKCFGRSPTVACEQIHPIVGIPSPEGQASKFQSRLIMPIRNPATVIPAHQQGKAEKYHQQQGQVPIDSWRGFRDAYLEESLWKGWRGLIDTWTSMIKYEVGLYVPYEHLVSVEQGPALARQIATMLRDAGFPVVDNDSAECVWFHTVQPLVVALGHPHYHYAVDYIPGYTITQKQYLISQLKEMQHDYTGDAALQAILDEYVQEVLSDTVTDTNSNRP
jgi:hypothetical protein